MTKYMLDLPDPNTPGRFISSGPYSDGRALELAREYGADEHGNICLITPLAGEEEEKEEGHTSCVMRICRREVVCDLCLTDEEHDTCADDQIGGVHECARCGTIFNGGG